MLQLVAATKGRQGAAKQFHTKEDLAGPKLVPTIIRPVWS